MEPVSDGGETPEQAVDKTVATTHSWRDALPSDLKNHDLVKDFSKPGDIVRDYIRVKTEAGSLAKIPGEGASEDDRNSFYEKIGYPKDGKYGLQRPENIPEEQFDNAAMTEFEKVSGSLRLSKSQVEGLYNWYNKFSTDRLSGIESATKQATESAISTLKQEWQGDSFDKNVKIATRAFREVGGGELGKSFEEFVNTKVVDGVKLGNHPLFLKYFHALGKSVLEDSGSVQGGAASAADEMDDAAIARKMFPSMVAKDK